MDMTHGLVASHLRPNLGPKIKPATEVRASDQTRTHDHPVCWLNL